MVIVFVIAMGGCAGRTPIAQLQLDEYLARADSCAGSCYWEQAESYLNEAIRLYPTHIEPWLLLGTIFEEQHEYERALGFWNRIISVRSQEKEAIIGRWNSLHALYLIHQSDSLEQQLRNDIEKWDALRPRTQLSMELAYTGWRLLGDDSSAERVGAILAFRHPESEESRDYESRLFYMTINPLVQDPAKSVQVLSDFLSRQQTSPWRFEAYRLLANAYEKKRDYNSLARTLRAFRAEMPNDPRALEISARMYLNHNLGDYRALQYARRAVDALVSFPPPPVYSVEQWRRERCRLITSGSIRYAQALLRRGDVETAQRVIDDLLGNSNINSTCDVSLSGAYVLLAETYLAKGKNDMAIDALIEALIIGDPGGTWEWRAQQHFSQVLREMSIDAHPLYYSRGLKRYPGPRFRDVTTRTGLPATTSTHVAWVDYDNDGWDDIILDGRILLKNIMGSRFEDKTTSVQFPARRMGAAPWCDIDNDGTPNVLMIPDDPTLNAELFQLVEGRFTCTDTLPSSGSLIQAATIFDADLDGSLDIFLARGERSEDQTDIVHGDMLLINQNSGNFIDKISEFMIDSEPVPGRRVGIADIDDDGYMDMLVTARNSKHLRLYSRDQNGVFTNTTCTSGLFSHERTPYTFQSVRCSWADYDGDGDLDIFCTQSSSSWDHDSTDRCMLFEQIESDHIRFTQDVSDRGIRCAGSHSEPTWCDVDLDGDIDLLLVADNMGRGCFLYLNNEGSFIDATYLSGLDVSNALGCAISDYDHDGDQDVIIATTKGVRLFRNEADKKWLAIHVVGNGVTTNTDCIGCKIELHSNDHTQYREISHSKNTCNQSSLTQFFGFKNDVDVSTIRIRFTDGEILDIPGVAPNQLVVVHQ